MRRRRRESAVDIYHLIKQAQHKNIITLVITTLISLGGLSKAIDESMWGLAVFILAGLVVIQSLINIFRLRKQVKKLMAGDKDVNTSTPDVGTMFWFNKL